MYITRGLDVKRATHPRILQVLKDYIRECGNLYANKLTRNAHRRHPRITNEA